MLGKIISFLSSPKGTRISLGWLMVIPRARRRSREGSPHSVLIVRLDNIGDVVLNTPLLREVRRNLPAAWITLVVRPEMVALMRNCPYVNQVLAYHRARGDGGRADLRRRWNQIRFAVQELWPRKFDLAISPRRDVDQQDAALLCYLSGAPRRVGFTVHASELKEQQNSGIESLFTEILPAPQTHEVLSNLSVLTHLGFAAASNSLELWADKSDESWADQTLAGDRHGNQLIALCPGASYIEKQWPHDRFIEVARELLKNPEARMVILGGPGEASATAIQEALGERCINLAGRATLLQTYAVLRRCRLYVGNDTGPMHLAVAAGVPVVEVCMFPRTLGEWNRNSPARFGPWGVPGIIVQPDHPEPPCTDVCNIGKMHCILGVNTGAVLQAALELAGVAAH